MSPHWRRWSEPNAGRVLAVLLAVILLSLPTLAVAAKGGSPGKPGGDEETAGNNLSFPVLWSEGVTKTLPGTPAMTPILQGEWWYWWGLSGTDPNIVPLSCAPDPDDTIYCDDGIAGQATGDLPGTGAVRAYLQKDLKNTWQADSADASAAPLVVDWIDWGDNLESADWYTTSQVRTEVVLFQDLATPMLEYGMRWLSGMGIDEVHGVATAGDPPTAEIATYDYVATFPRATVYSPCARLTLQKLLVPREDTRLATLTWDPTEGWAGEGLVNPPIFNSAVHEALDGPGYFNAEINVKGRIIYGYTWNVKKLNDMTGGTPAGDYRITFSFDETCGSVALNTFFEPGVEGGDPGTRLMVPLEEEEVTADAEGDEGGATAIIDFTNNLTYIDVRILGRTGGSGRPR